MRLAVLSDIHADAAALEDALARIDALAPDRIVCAGDVVDYGERPDDTVALLTSREIPCIRGNHDRWGAAGGTVRNRWDPARGTAEFLRSLPATHDLDLGGVRVAVRHGTPFSDMRGIWPYHTAPAELARFLDEVKAEILVVGHTHIPFAMEVEHRGLIVNPGALLRAPGGRVAGKPLLFDANAKRFVPGTAGTGGGTFGILDSASRTFTVHRASDGSEVQALRLTVTP